MFRFKPGDTGAGILLYSAGVFFFALNDAIAKWLIADYGVGQIMLLRTFGAGAVLTFLLWRSKARIRPQGQYGLHLLRVLCSSADTFAFYFAVKALPLADVMTFYMAAPLMIVVISAPLLGEHVGISRWVAVLVGFVGVVIALHPSAATVSASALIALAGSAMFAASMAITRKLRGTHWLTLVAYQFFGSGLIGAATAGLHWTTPGPADMGLMFAVGIASMACFMAITKALALAPASLLAPLQYASIAWATLLGWLIWGDVPSTSTTVGVLIIMASGLFVLRARRNLPVRPEPA